MVTSNRNGHINKAKRWYKTCESGIQVHWLQVPYSNQMKFTERVKAFIKFAISSAIKAASLDGDIIFATSTPLTIAIPAVYAAKRRHLPMVFEVRDLWPDLPIAVGALKSKIMISAAKWLEEFAYKNAERVIALSPGMRRGIIKAGYPGEKIYVIPNSADLKLFEAGKENGNKFRNQNEWLQNRPLVVYVGTIGYINGVSYLVKIATATITCEPEIRFLVVGDGKEKHHIRELARSLGILNKNFFMLDSVAKKAVPKILNASTVATSLFIDLEEMQHNSANKFFDALASGTPIAINYGGWQADILRKYKAGIVLNSQDINHAKDSLIKAIHDDEWVKKAGENARIVAEKVFDRDKLARKLEGVLKDAISNE
jgi:glycosyltransferase involved in cell wall biosynthesis